MVSFKLFSTKKIGYRIFVGTFSEIWSLSSFEKFYKLQTIYPFILMHVKVIRSDAMQ